MTLSTHIYITGKIDHREVFNKVNDLLNIPASRIEQVGPSQHRDGIFEISNRVGQGFDAWVLSYAREDGTPIFDEYNEYDRRDQENGFTRPLKPSHFIDVNLDTGYAFQGPAGEGCAVLHAKVIVDLYNWLQEREIGLSWTNEFTGEIHDGLNGIEGFIGSGDAARNWYENVVVPAIPNILGKES